MRAMSAPQPGPHSVLRNAAEVVLLAGWTTPTDINNGLNDFINNTFAYLGSQGYAGQRYPIWVAEFGTGLDLFSTEPAYSNQLDVYFWGGSQLCFGSAARHAAAFCMTWSPATSPCSVAQRCSMALACQPNTG